MVNAALRIELSHDIRRLATGRMTNDAFDDRYYDAYESSDDQAIKSIAAYCYGLYSSDLLFPIRMRGRHALDRETKKTIARCILFLRCGAEYEWPARPDDPCSRILAGLAFSLGFPAGVALSLVGLLVAIVDPGAIAFLLLAAGLPLLALSYWFALLRPTMPASEWQRYTESGDYECWPFLQRESFQMACNRKHPIGHNGLR